MRWRSIGPALPEGRASAVVGSNAHALLYYAGTADGGVWKSVDGGTAWQNISDFIHFGSVGTIAVQTSTMTPTFGSVRGRPIRATTSSPRAGSITQRTAADRGKRCRSRMRRASRRFS